MEQPPDIHWPVPAVFPALGRGEIHLWCAWLDDHHLAASPNESPLSADERARAAAFHFDRDRRRYVAARLVLRRLLGRYLRTGPAALAFAYGPQGKPALTVSGSAADLQFNLSHSGPLALLALARSTRLGTDLEQLRELPDLASLEERVFVAGDCPRQRALAPPARQDNFYRRWTQLEASGKFWGTGLDLDHAAPVPDQVEPADPAAGFIGCIAYDGPPLRVRTYRGTPEALIAPAENTVESGRRLPGLPHRPGSSPRLYFS